MFKSRKKRQQQQQQLQLQQQQQQQLEQQQEHIIKKDELGEYKLLDDLKSANDFRSSVILPQLVKDMSPTQAHLTSSSSLQQVMPSVDGTKQYHDLAAWRHERSQHRYSNGLFGGQQRDRPKVSAFKDDSKQKIDEEEEEEDEEDEEKEKEERNHEKQPASPRDKEEEEEDQENAMLEEEEYEPDSDMEENFFFKDFSAASQPRIQIKGRPRNKTAITPSGSRFDLSSFARDLHEHRLSVVQPRESRIIMTEEDEQELEKLLTLQRQRMSMMETASIKDEMPPLPSLEKINSYKPVQLKQQQNRKKEEQVNRKEQEEKIKIQEKPKEMIQDDKKIEEDTHTASSIKNHPIKQVEINKVAQNPVTPFTPQSPTPPKSPRVLKPVASISTSSIHAPVKELMPIKRSVSTTSIRSQHKQSTGTKLAPIPEPAKTKRDPNFRKSMSMDDITAKLEVEPSITSAALEWIDDDNKYNNSNNLYNIKNNDNNKYSAGTNIVNHHHQHHYDSIEKSSPQPAKSLGLFGSLKQVSRSKTHSGHKTSIRGLVRNLSTSHHNRDRNNQHHELGASNNGQQRKSDQGMSRAAMAVIQHNVAKHEQNKINPIIPNEKRNSDEAQKRFSDNNNTNSRTSGTGLLSQLLSRASKQRRTTKTTNMEDEKSKDARKRAQVVRRTIIYVQPNSLHDLLKNGGDIGSKVPPPPVPALMGKYTKNATGTSDGSLSADDETIQSQEYVTATKVVRQASVRKRIVENTENPNVEPTVTREGSQLRKRWQLKSMDENEVQSGDESSNSDYLEGVELREMSDGSVVWGIVKKQGNRKSFYSPQNQIEEEVEEEDVNMQQELKQLTEKKSYKQQQQQQSHLNPNSTGLSPPPIPKRSPRRQAERDGTNHVSTISSKDQSSTTDIYYSDVSLPNLLKMMKKQQQEIDGINDDDDIEEANFNERAMASVDEQLDEMMRSLTSQQ